MAVRLGPRLPLGGDAVALLIPRPLRHWLWGPLDVCEAGRGGKAGLVSCRNEARATGLRQASLANLRGLSSFGFLLSYRIARLHPARSRRVEGARQGEGRALEGGAGSWLIPSDVGCSAAMTCFRRYFKAVAMTEMVIMLLIKV